MVENSLEGQTKLQSNSFLGQAAQLHDQMRKLKQEDTGRDHQTFLQRPYADSQSREAVEKAPVWFSAYMPSIIGCEEDGQMDRPLETLCDLYLWQHFAELGVKAIHTGPVMKAGGRDLDGRTYATIDGWFDPIALEIDPVLGTDRDYARLVWIAENIPNAAGEKFKGCVIGDIVPGHTGMGPDFHLALQGYEHYPGLYVLARVDEVLSGDDPRSRRLSKAEIASLTRDSTSVGQEQEFTRLLDESEVAALVKAKVIPGKPQRSLGAQAGFGWSITNEIAGVADENGRSTRRWVYLHFFHPKQPTLNFVDPSYGAWRLVTGELNYVIWNLRSTGVRLDANAFLGIEPRGQGPQVSGDAIGTWSEAHPLSYTVTNMLAWQCRRLGGFSFQEMNMAVPDIAKSFEFGPDLAYDFITRPACEHALLTGDVSLLSFMYEEMKRLGVDTGCLVHALQNHDEITYELVHLKHVERSAADGTAPGPSYLKTADDVRAEMRRAALHRAGDTDSINDRVPSSFYNQESSNGLCTTIPGMIAARLGCRSLGEAFGKVEEIQLGHLLLAAFNALQPGVFALSGWDVVGALPVEQSRVPSVLLNAGPVEKEDPLERDYRWVNRGAYRLLSTFGSSSEEDDQRYGCLDLPEAKALYGPMDRQRIKPSSFFNQIKRLISIRDGLHIPTSEFGGILTGLDVGLFGFRMCLTSPKDKDHRLGAAVVLFNFQEPEHKPVLVRLHETIRLGWPDLVPYSSDWRDAELDYDDGILTLEKKLDSRPVGAEVAISSWNWKVFYLPAAVRSGS